MKIPIYKAKSLFNDEKEVIGFYCCSVYNHKNNDEFYSYENKTLDNYLITMNNNNIDINYIDPDTLEFYCFVEPASIKETVRTGILYTIFKGEEYEKEFRKSLH